jgi:hypothetical protein
MLTDEIELLPHLLAQSSSLMAMVVGLKIETVGEQRRSWTNPRTLFS